MLVKTCFTDDISNTSTVWFDTSYNRVVQSDCSKQPSVHGQYYSASSEATLSNSTIQQSPFYKYLYRNI